MHTPPAIRIVDDVTDDVPPSWRRRPVASLERSRSRHVVYDPNVVAVVRCGPHQTSPLTSQLHATGFRPLDAEPAVWWRPNAAVQPHAALHAAAA